MIKNYFYLKYVCPSGILCDIKIAVSFAAHYKVLFVQYTSVLGNMSTFRIGLLTANLSARLGRNMTKNASICLNYDPRIYEIVTKEGELLSYNKDQQQFIEYLMSSS